MTIMWRKVKTLVDRNYWLLFSSQQGADQMRNCTSSWHPRDCLRCSAVPLDFEVDRFLWSSKGSSSVWLHDQKCESSLAGWAVKIKNQKKRGIHRELIPRRGGSHAAPNYLSHDSTRDSDILLVRGIQCRIYKEATNTPRTHASNLPRLDYHI